MFGPRCEWSVQGQVGLGQLECIYGNQRRALNPTRPARVRTEPPGVNESEFGDNFQTYDHLIVTVNDSLVSLRQKK